MTKGISLDTLLASLDDTPEIEKVAAESAVAEPVEDTLQTAAKELENILTKKAHEVDTNMSNAKQKGQAIADSVMALVKQAMEGNQVIAQTSAQIASSSAGQVETPREGASITQTLQGLAANSIAQGAVRPDALDENLDSGKDEASAGKDGVHMTTSDGHPTKAVDHEEVEKVAACVALVDAGVSFDEAVALVKQAEAELIAEEVEHVKVAAVNALMSEGMDIESALTLVKVAMEADTDAVRATLGKK